MKDWIALRNCWRRYLNWINPILILAFIVWWTSVKHRSSNFWRSVCPKWCRKHLRPSHRGARRKSEHRWRRSKPMQHSLVWRLLLFPRTILWGRSIVHFKSNWQKAQIFRHWRPTYIPHCTPSLTGTMRTATSFPSVATRKACTLSLMKAKK